MAHPSDPEAERLTRREIPGVDLVRHHYNRRALWGSDSVLYRRRHPMDWSSVVGNYQNWVVDTTQVMPSDATSPHGEPLRLFFSEDVEVSVSRRRESMPHFVRNCDADEVHLVSVGQMSYETDFGTLEVGPRDVVVIPKGVTYRVLLAHPHDTHRLILESRPEVFLVPTEMVEHVYHKGRPALNPQAIQRATLTATTAPSGRYEVRVKYTGAFSDFLGQISRVLYDFYPLDAEIIDGEVGVYKFSVADIEKLSSTPVPFLGGAYLDNAKNLAWTLHLSGGGDRAPVHRDPDVDEFRYLSSGPKLGSILFTPQGVDHGAGRGYTKVDRNRPSGPYDTGDTLSAYTLKPLRGTPEAFQVAHPIMC